MPNPMRRPTVIPGSSASFIITLKSLRNPPLSLSLSSQPSSTSIHELKTVVAKHVGIEGGAIGNIRILYKKKPCSDLRTVKEVLGDDNLAHEVEFSVMIMGGSATTGTAQGEDEGRGEEEKTSVAQGPSGEAVIESEEFWKDLNGFLVQRIRDEEKAEELWQVFREAWRQRGES